MNKNIKLGPKQIAWSNLNLLEVIFSVKRGSLRVIFNKKKIKASDYEQVSEYIKQRFIKKLLG